MADGQAQRGGPHRFAAVGAGRFAHLYHLPALLAHPRADLTMICDPTPSEHTIDLARRADIPIVADLDAVLQPDICDAVVISTPDRLHAPQVRRALEAGKHVLVDKPFVLDGATARDLTSMAERRQLVTAVAFNQRFSTAYRHAQRLVAEGELGTIRRVETIQLGGDWVISQDGSAPRQTGSLRPAWYQDPSLAGGGVLVGRGAHMADIVPWVLGRRPAQLRAEVLPGVTGQVDRGGTADLDFGDLTWRFASLADPAPLWDDVRIYGSAGRLEIRKPEGTLGFWSLSHCDIHDLAIPTPEPGVDTVAVDDFIGAIEGLHPPRCDFASACTSVDILEAMYASAASGGGWLPARRPHEGVGQ